MTVQLDSGDYWVCFPEVLPRASLGDTVSPLALHLYLPILLPGADVAVAILGCEIEVPWCRGAEWMDAWLVFQLLPDQRGSLRWASYSDTGLPVISAAYTVLIHTGPESARPVQLCLT